MARRGVLEQVTLAEHFGDCVPLDDFPAGVLPSLDVGGLQVSPVGTDHVVVIVDFDFELSTAREHEVVCDITAVFRLVYRIGRLRSEADRREFASKVAVVDAWPYWRVYLTNTMTLMGLQPLHLSPEPPAELEASAREAFDVSFEAAREAEKKATGKGGE